MKTTAKLVCLTLTSLLSWSSYYSYAQGGTGGSPCCPDTGGVKYLQSPDLAYGIDVNATFFPPDPVDGRPWVLADDFPCTTSGPITDIHLWGSWLNDQVDYNAVYTLAIWSDAPANTAGTYYSHPNQLLWTQTYTNGQYTLCPYTNQFEAFYDGDSALTGVLSRLGGSSNLFYLCFDASPTNTFYQTGTTAAPTNYWLSVTVQSFAGTNFFGWKSSATAYNDAAVSASSTFYPQPGDWTPMTDVQGLALNMAFKITTATNPCSLVIACPSNIVVTACTNVPVYYAPTASNPCCGSNVTVVCSPLSGSLFAPGTTTPVNCMATDCNGNSNSCSFTVTVQCCTNFTVICPPGKTVPCGSAWSFDPPLAATCCTNLIAGTSGVLTNLLILPTGLVTNGACSNLITETWQISDGCGNTTNCSQTVTILNTNPPFILCPPNILVSACSNVQEFYTPFATAVCGLTNVTVVCTPPSGSYFTPGTTTTVNCTATDCSGNSNSCSFTVTVKAQLNVLCPTNKTVVLGSNWTFDPPLASTCCTNLITSSRGLTNLLILPTGLVTNGACPRYDVTQTWQISDGCGDITNCSQTVTVLCCVAPPTNMVLWLPFDETVGPTSANLASPGNPGTQVGGPPVVLGAYVDNSLAFNGVNQYVTVPDYPGIDIGTGNLTIDAWVLRSPNDGNSPPSVIVDKRDVNSGIGYSLSLSYGELILTLSGNNYRDTLGYVPPDGQWHFVAVVLNQTSSPASIQFYVDTGPTATAAPVPGNLANTHGLWVAASPLGGNQPWLGDLDEVEVYDRALANGELAAIYNSGTAGKCKPPCTGISVICPPGKTVPCGSPWNFDPPLATTCCTNLIVGTSGGLTNLLILPTGLVTNGACSNLITETWQISDGCGNTTNCSQTVTILNTNPPFILCPPNILVSACSNVQEFYTPFATAACGLTNVTVVCTPPSGSYFAPGTTTTVNCTATDCSGNSNSCSFTVTVKAQLNVLCPTNKTVVLGSNWTFDPPLASTCCTNLIASSRGLTNLLILPTGLVTNGACPRYDVTQTWQISDGCGDTTNCSQTVTVLCCVAPPTNMVLWLPFDETVGPTSANLASPGNPGTQVGGPPVVLGAYVDNSLAFNGVNQYVTVPDYPGIDIGTGNLTIDAWVLRSPNDGNSPPSVIVDKRDVNSGIGYSLSLSYGELILTLSGNNYRDTLGYVPPDGQWHFVAVVLNQASTTPFIQFYVDTGPTATATPVPGNLANTHPLWVAASPLGGNQPWLGDLDEVEIYDRALANGELAAIYSAGTAGKCKPPCTGISVICPPGKTVPCGSAWNFDPPLATTCCTNLIAGTSGVLTNLLIMPTGLVTNGACSNLITETWQISDGCGNTTNCSQTVAILNTNPPFILCPPNILVSACSNVQEFYTPFATAACGLTNVTVVCTPPSGSYFAPGTTTTVNCTATDCSGNSNTCSFTVTVKAQLNVLCPTNKTVVLGSNWTFDPPLASTCCTNLIAGNGVLTNLVITPIGLVTNGACPRYDVTQTWQISDGCGDTTNCSQTVTVLCCVAPPTNMVLWLPFDETVGPTSANLASLGNPGTQMGGPPVVLGAYVDNSLAFNGVNQYVTVPDYPGIDIGTGNLTIDAWVLRSPNDGNSPPSVIVDKRDVNSGIGYSLSLSYGELILTLSGNNYRDTLGYVPPDGQWHFVAVVLNQTSSPASIQFYVDTGPTATAAPVPGNLANTHGLWVAASPLGGNQPWLGDLDEVEVYDRALANGELAAIYNSGTAGKCKPPCTGLSVICSTNKTVPCRSAWSFDPPVATTCCTNLIVGTSGVLTNLLVIPTTPVTNGICPKFITEIWQISDGCGDNMTCTQVVKVVDTIPPVITCLTNTVVVALNSNCLLVIPVIRASATDNCTPASQLVYSQSPPAGTVMPPGVHSWTVTVTVTDLCGNSSHCYVRIIGVDQTGPVVTCPATMTVTNCLVPCVPVTATDNCCPPASLRITQSPPCNTPLGPGITSITVTVTDCHGNSTTKVVRLVIIGTESFLSNLFNTGVDATHALRVPNGATDLHYTLGPVPAGTLGYVAPTAVVVTNLWGWLEVVHVSEWIAPDLPNIYSCPSGYYTYTNQFVLPAGANAASASISGRWAADDGAAMYFNGVLLPANGIPVLPVASGFNHWHPFTISGGFLPNPSPNTILFVVTNSAYWSPGPTGLRVEYTNALVNCYTCTPPSVISITPGQSLPEFSSATLHVVAGGTPPLSYQWYLNNVPLVNNGHDSGVTTPTLHISPLAFSDAGLYTVVVSNPCGTVINHVRLVVTYPWWWQWGWWNVAQLDTPLAATVGPDLNLAGSDAGTTFAITDGTTEDFGLANPGGQIVNAMDVAPLPAGASIQVPLIAPAGSSSDNSYTVIMDLYEPDTSLGTPSTLFQSISCCVSNLSSGGQDGVALTLDAANNLHLTGSAAGMPFDVASAAPLPVDAWSRVALVVDDPQDGLAVNLSLYLNGQPVASLAVPTPVGLPVNWSNSPPTLLSRQTNDVSFNGEFYLSSIQFHAIALSPAQLAGIGSPDTGPAPGNDTAVGPQPVLSVTMSGGMVSLGWTGSPYVLQETTDLTSGVWADSVLPFTESPVNGNMLTTASAAPPTQAPQKFYRLIFRP